MMGRKAGWFAKFLTANLIACFLFCLVGNFYYYGGQGVNGPIADETMERSEENGRISRLWHYEGHCVGRLDSNGYNNAYYVERGLDVGDVDVLIMGSSHVEAFQVPMRSNFTYLLNLKFENDLNRIKFYNCARSGHWFSINAARCDDALSLFKPRRYLALELWWSVPDLDSIKKTLNDEYENVRPASPAVRAAIKWIRGLPWARSVLLSMRNAGAAGEDKNGNVEGKNADPPEELTSAWRAVLKNIAEISKKHGVQPIVFFHSRFALGKDGSISPIWNVAELAAFREICENEGIVFVDATERFRVEYEENDVWPYGFYNTNFINGHLNGEGHRVVADVLEETIRRLEAQKEAENGENANSGAEESEAKNVL